jgi:AcrR family transcriptional regulator
VEKDERRGHIICTAWKLFESLGYKATTVDAIAREAGMGKGTFYLSFKSKEEILAAILDQSCTGISATVDEIMAYPAVSLADFLERFLCAFLGYREDYRLIQRLSLEARYQATASASAAAVNAARTRVQAHIQNEVARCLRRFETAGLARVADREIAAVALVSLYDALIEKTDAEGKPFSAERIKAALRATLVGGLARSGIGEDIIY